MTAQMDPAVDPRQVVTALVLAYTRGGGRDYLGNLSPDLEAVVATASARLKANPGQVRTQQTSGPFTHSVDAGFQGWTLAELAALNRYRVRAM